MVLPPLQLGMPGAVELLILLVVFAVIGVLVARWIYHDAKSRDSPWAWQWAVGIVFLFIIGILPGIIGLLVYRWVRGERHPSPA